MIFTINEHNEIVAFASTTEAAAGSTTPFETFSSQEELAALANTWPGARLIDIWNSLPGVTPVKKFTNHTTAIRRIWARIQNLGQPSQPKTRQQATGRARLADEAPTAAKASKKATSAKGTPKRQRAAHPSKPNEPRPGSKAAQVISMLRRKNGATLSEIVERMQWQVHTVRGFMAGAMKKAGYAVESFKSEKGERSYRLPVK